MRFDSAIGLWFNRPMLASPPPLADDALIGEAPPSPAGPLAAGDVRPDNLPPAIPLPRALQTLRFSVRQIEFVFGWRRKLGETFRFRGMIDDDYVVVTSHPDHVKSLFTARPDDAPSLTGESPLRPIVGPNSVLTALGPRHLRQRKLLLPPFHGEAVQRYAEMIAEVADREIDAWPIGEPIRLAPRMQAITLDVIMAGIFGVEGLPEKGTPARSLRDTIQWAVGLSVRPEAQLFELINLRSEEARGPMKRLLDHLDRHLYAVIDERRADPSADERTDIMSLLMRATDEEGVPLTDRELRDELLTLVLAGHETTANSLAWAFERLVRTPAAYDRLRDVSRSGDAAFADDDGYIEATIHETMRSRPVIPTIGRRVMKPWELGEFRVPAGTSVLMSILLLHHREDVYPDPYGFRPERFVGVRPGTYTWIPFGGGIRRCLGASFALFEMRVVLQAILAGARLQPTTEPAPRITRRFITFTPADGGVVTIAPR